MLNDTFSVIFKHRGCVEGKGLQGDGDDDASRRSFEC